MDSKPESPRFILILGSLFLLAYAAYNVGAAWMDSVPENAFVTVTPTPTVTQTPTLTPTSLPLYWITPTLKPGEASPTPEMPAAPEETTPDVSPTPTPTSPIQPPTIPPTFTLTSTSEGGGNPGPEATPSPTLGPTETQNPYPGVPTDAPTSFETQNPYPGVPTNTPAQPYPGPGATATINPTNTPTPGGAEPPTATSTLMPTLQLTTPATTPTAAPPLPSVTGTLQPVETLPFSQVLVLAGGSVNQVSWSADGGSLALATSKGLYLYDAENLEKKAIFDAGNAIISSQFAFDDFALVTGGADATIRWWEVATQRYLGELTGHLFGVVRLGLPSFGNFLVSGSDDATVRVWDINQGLDSDGLLFIFRDSVTRVTDLDVTANGNMVAASSQRHVHIWQPLTGELYKTLSQPEGWYTALAFSPDDQTLVTAYDGRRLEFWDTVTWRRLKFISLSAPVRSLAYSPDGRLLAIGYEDGRIQIREAHSKALLADLPGHPGLNSAAFNADSTQLATGSSNGTLRVWDVSQINLP